MSVETLQTRLKNNTNITDKKRDSFVLNGSGVGVWDWNVKTGETYFNDRWAEIIGYTLEELEPVSIATWLKFAHPDDLKRSDELLQKHFRGETDYYEFESRMRHKDGHWVWVLDRGKVFEWDENGAPVRMCGSHFDLSGLRKKEEQLKASNEKLNKFFDIIDVGITITDEQGNIIDCNSASERMLGITKEEHLSRNYAGKEWKIIREDFTELPPEQYASVKALTENRSVRNEIMGVYKKDHRVTWLSVSASPLSMDGYGVLIAYNDITDLMETKAQLMEANKTKDKFVSMIAHDLRNPLSGIQGLTELASLSLSREDHSEVDQYLEIIKESTKRGSDLIFNLLQWSRLQSSSIEFSPKVIDLNVHIKDTVALVFSSIQEKGLHLKIRKVEQLMTFADPFMLDIILRNLITNAIKYSFADGTITIDTRIEDGSVWVSIKDEGVGIEPLMVKNLFTISTIKSSDGTKGEKGTGLGLILCKEFITLNGGEIRVQSEPGKGSEFTFSLPCASGINDN